MVGCKSLIELLLIGGNNNHEHLRGVYSNMCGAFVLIFSMQDEQNDFSDERLVLTVRYLLHLNIQEKSEMDEI